MAIKTVSRQRVSVGSAVAGSSYGTTIPITTVITTSTNPVISALYITDSSYAVLDDTAVNSLGGYIKLIGTNFTAGCTVYINGQAAPSTTFVSSTEVRAQVNAGTAGSTVSVMVFNDPTQGAIWGSGLYYSGFPSISATSFTNISTAVNVQLPATGDSTLVYSLKSGSSLPAGITLSSTGLISGTASGVSVNSVFTFTILINDSQLQTTQVDISLSIIITDASFNLTTLSLTNTGVNNANNTSTFKDYSLNNYASTGTSTGITSNSSFSPFGLHGWSGYFSSTSSDYLTVGTSTDWTYLSNGSSDYTIEAWIYPTTTSTLSQTILGNNTATTITSTGTSLSINNTSSSGFINFTIYNGGQPFVLSTSSYIPLNQWQHLAVTLTTSTKTAILYYNGSPIGSYSSSTYSFSTFAPSNTLNIGRGVAATPGNYFNGFISNVRIVKGLPVYSGTFTVANSILGVTQSANPYGGSNTQPISTGTYTTLLTLQSNRFIDVSTGTVNTGSRVTQFNLASIQPFSPYPPTGDYSTSTVGGSIFFNGTTDFINAWGVPTSVVGVNNVTCEAWIYPTTSTNANMTIGSTFGPTSPGGGFRWWINPTGGMTVANGTQNAFSVTGLQPMYNQWNHVAVVRETGWCMGYLNGRKITTTADIGNFGVSAAAWGVGQLQIGTEAANTRFQGYISNFRFIRDTALYNTSTVTYNVPTAQFTATSTGTAVNTSTIVGTATLILLKGLDSGIYDATSRNTIITSNQVRVSTGVTRYGSGSVYFPGLGGNRLIIPSGPLNALSYNTNTDFTIELWVYPLSLSTNVVLVSQGAYSSGEFFLRINSDGSLDFTEASTLKMTLPIGSVVVNQWQHLAIVRSNGLLQGYVGGIRSASTASTYAYTSTNVLYLGSNPNTVSQDFNGYIDDLRISRVARYSGTTYNQPNSKFLTR